MIVDLICDAVLLWCKLIARRLVVVRDCLALGEKQTKRLEISFAGIHAKI